MALLPAELSHGPPAPCRYLTAVIWESMRLFPAIPGGQIRTCPLDVVVDGHRVPRGTTLWLPIWSLHRSPANWKDAAVFSPERWLGGAGAGAEVVGAAAAGPSGLGSAGTAGPSGLGTAGPSERGGGGDAGVCSEEPGRGPVDKRVEAAAMPTKVRV